MTHKLKTEMFSQKIEYSGGVFLWALTPLFSFVSFHLKVSLGSSLIEGASATRYLNPLLGKTELSIMSCSKHVSSSDYLPFTIEMSQEMHLKVFSMILQRS